MIHLALPRDLSLPILAGWIWLGFWTSDQDPYQEASQALVGWLGVTVAPSKLERLRNGWTFLAGTILAVGFTWLCVFVFPYWWLT